MRNKLALVATLVAGLLGGLALPAAASAAGAVVTTDLNLRGGPGTQYARLATIPDGSPVEVIDCNASNWCQIVWGRRQGWVAGSYLAYLGGSYPPAIAGPAIVAPPIITIFPPVQRYRHYEPRRPRWHDRRRHWDGDRDWDRETRRRPERRREHRPPQSRHICPQNMSCDIRR